MKLELKNYQNKKQGNETVTVCYGLKISLMW